MISPSFRSNAQGSAAGQHYYQPLTVPPSGNAPLSPRPLQPFDKLPLHHGRHPLIYMHFMHIAKAYALNGIPTKLRPIV